MAFVSQIRFLQRKFWKIIVQMYKKALTSRHSKSNPIELNFNHTQSNSIELNPWIEFGNQTKSKSTKRNKNQSSPIERSIFELVICVKQALKIPNQILETRVTPVRSVAHVFFVNEEITQKWLQMPCGL